MATTSRHLIERTLEARSPYRTETLIELAIDAGRLNLADEAIRALDATSCEEIEE